MIKPSITTLSSLNLVFDLTDELRSVINKCPATIFATNRTESLIGRIKDLKDSIITIKGKRAKGEPVGTKCASIKFG